MLEPQHRFPALVLAAGAIVLLLSIVLGRHMGDRVLDLNTERRLPPVAAVTPEPYETAGPYGPDWRRSEALSSAPDPHFPDPRVPPKPLPTLPPPPTPSPSPVPTATYNPNIPIWRQQPLPTLPPSPAGPDGATPGPSPTVPMQPRPADGS